MTMHAHPNDSLYNHQYYGVLWGLLWTPSFFPRLGLWFRARGWVLLEKEWGVSSFSKFQTCIQINKNKKMKNKHFIFIIQNKNKKHIKIKLKKLASPCMFSWGTFQQIFITKIIFLKKIAALHLCVCPTWFKETVEHHNVRRSRVPTSLIYKFTNLSVTELGFHVNWARHTSRSWNPGPEKK
jgi:hypothetical protein